MPDPPTRHDTSQEPLIPPNNLLPSHLFQQAERPPRPAGGGLHFPAYPLGAGEGRVSRERRGALRPAGGYGGGGGLLGRAAGGGGGPAPPPGRSGAGPRRQQGDPAEEHQAAGGGAAHRLGAARRQRRRRLPQVRMREGGLRDMAGVGGCHSPGGGRRGVPGSCPGLQRVPRGSPSLPTRLLPEGELVVSPGPGSEVAVRWEIPPEGAGDLSMAPRQGSGPSAVRDKRPAPCHGRPPLSLPGEGELRRSQSLP